MSFDNVYALTHVCKCTHTKYIEWQKRILNIANYHTISYRKKLYSFFLYIITAVFLLCFIPFLSIQTAGNSYYSFNRHNKNITYTDLKSYFGKNKGSFVMYNTTDNLWQIYNQEYALTRISPVSTYKIYSALFCLESGIISPSQSLRGSSWTQRDSPEVRQ